MGISQGIGNSAAGARARAASGRSFHKILYRLWLLVAMLAGFAVLLPAVAAQEDRPEIMPGERKAAGKKDLGPRAVGLLRLTASGKASLVPIAILINGKFWDAAAYKAAPVPMALDSGIVYEVERAGNSLGLFTVGSALHSIAANAPTPWLATGVWLPEGKEAQNKPLKAETAPVGIQTGEGPPRLTRNPQKAAPPENTAPATPPPSGPSSGDEPPRLTKPKEETPASTAPASSAPNPSSGTAGSSQTGSSQPSAQPAAQPSAQPSVQTAPNSTGSAAPAESKQAETKPPDRPRGPESDSGASDANRPRLRRGKPTAPLPDEDVPGYSKPGAAPAATAAKTVAAAAGPEPVQLIPAISDAAGPDPHSFTFTWFADEEAKHREQMTALARQQLLAYLQAQAKSRITSQPSPSPRRASVQKLAEPVFENVHMAAYDLWTNNQPLMILSAEAHMPPAGAQASIDSGLVYSIVVVAYPDIYNNLHKIYAGVTDKYHLDVTPRLELIDAVDADGDGRGELLFRETSDAGSGWVIYRPTADTLWKMYDSLNPE